jgi:hypothetical protein
VYKIHTARQAGQISLFYGIGVLIFNLISDAGDPGDYNSLENDLWYHHQ